MKAANRGCHFSPQHVGIDASSRALWENQNGDCQLAAALLPAATAIIQAIKMRKQIGVMKMNKAETKEKLSKHEYIRKKINKWGSSNNEMNGKLKLKKISSCMLLPDCENGEREHLVVVGFQIRIKVKLTGSFFYVQDHTEVY